MIDWSLRVNVFVFVRMFPDFKQSVIAAVNEYYDEVSLRRYFLVSCQVTQHRSTVYDSYIVLCCFRDALAAFFVCCVYTYYHV